MKEKMNPEKEANKVLVFPEIDTNIYHRKFLDIPYANDSEYQKLDLYLPDDGNEPFPLIVFIHGGGFQKGDKRDIQVEGFMKLLKSNYAVASINYRLSFEALFPACIYDCKAAIRYLRAHAATFQIDQKRITAAGDSAGAHLALLVATTGGKPILEDLSMGNPEQSSDVNCAVALCPSTNFLTLFSQSEENEKRGIINLSNNSRDGDDPNSPEALFLGGALNSLDKDHIMRASPVAYISEKMPAVLLQHGQIDYIVPCQQSVEFFEKAKTIAGEERVELDVFEGALHMDPQFQTEQNMERIRQFIAKHTV